MTGGLLSLLVLLVALVMLALEALRVNGVRVHFGWLGVFCLALMALLLRLGQ